MRHTYIIMYVVLLYALSLWVCLLLFRRCCFSFDLSFGWLVC